MRRTVRAVRHGLGYFGLRLVLAAARFFPFSWVVGAGALLGRLATRVAPREVAHARAHLALAFPECDARWRQSTLQACGAHVGRLLGEVCWLWSAAPDSILSRTDFSGLEHLTEPLASGTGAVLITAHCGNWEWMNLALGAVGVPMTAAAREVYDPRIDLVVQTLRGRFGGDTVLRGSGAGQKLVRAIRDGRVVGLLIDQDIDIPGVFVEFFQRPAWTPNGAALLAIRTRCPVVTGFASRNPGGRMAIAFDPPVVPSSSGDLDGDVARLTAALTARIERQVRLHPDQWVWMHQRWRRQPEPGQKVWRATEPGDDGGAPRY